MSTSPGLMDGMSPAEVVAFIDEMVEDGKAVTFYIDPCTAKRVVLVNDVGFFAALLERIR